VPAAAAVDDIQVGTPMLKQLPTALPD